MLDYRAHKLLWLVLWPVNLVDLVASYVLMIVIALVARSEFPAYHPLLQVLGAWVVAQIAIGIISGFLFGLIRVVIRKVFFWVIDAVPAHGEDADEARAVVIQGPFYVLDKKMNSHLEDWTDKDTDAYVACLNWRVRWFFPIKQRTAHLIDELQTVQRHDGRQPWQLQKPEIERLGRKVGKPGWVEIAVTNPYAFHGLLGIVVIVVVVFWNR